MTDIVERLREGERLKIYDWWQCMGEAADEIERLRAALQKIADEADAVWTVDTAVEALGD